MEIQPRQSAIKISETQQTLSASASAGRLNSTTSSSNLLDSVTISSEAMKLSLEAQQEQRYLNDIVTPMTGGGTELPPWPPEAPK